MSTTRAHKALQAIVEKVKREYEPERIILFGSYAYGRPTEGSDLDLLIVKETPEPFHKRWAQVCRLVSAEIAGLDFCPFVVTPEELNRRLEMGDQFFLEIMAKGKVLYAK